MTNKNTDYDDQKKREIEWWEGKKEKKGLISRILSSKLFYDPIRSHFSYILSKNKFRDVIHQQLGNEKVKKILIAPCGEGDDYKYLKEFSDEIYGIDLSPIGIKSCPAQMITKKGDISSSGYPSESFDLVVSTLFFHHLVKVGFQPFLKEFYRILKPGGKIAILDFSVFYPLNAITRPLKTILRNPFGEIQEEAPFRPKYMIKSLKQVGFKNIELYGGTFSHCFFYIPLAKFIHFTTKPLLNKWPFKNFAWTVVFWGEKPR
ncbi:MAG: class I SAM-dependent methyltransferase [Promethearchaeota archaeon]|jgi:demethylmenaquinone methyltransferase/2-methoxy-6-polyprenyl-1,4-benzoquinol methylase